MVVGILVIDNHVVGIAKWATGYVRKRAPQALVALQIDTIDNLQVPGSHELPSFLTSAPAGCARANCSSVRTPFNCNFTMLRTMSYSSRGRRISIWEGN